MSRPTSIAFRLAVLAIASLFASCSSVYQVSVTAEPNGALVAVDGKNAGAAPVNQSFDFGRQRSSVVRATMAGFFAEEIVLDEESPYVAAGRLHLVLVEDPAWKVTTTSEATNNWLRQQVDPNIAGDDVWQKLIDTITNQYSSLEQLDSSSGYVRTIYRVRTFQGRAQPFRVRNRFICTIASREPLVYKLKIEAERTDNLGNWEPYDRVFKEDAEMVEELQGRLGIK